MLLKDLWQRRTGRGPTRFTVSKRTDHWSSGNKYQVISSVERCSKSSAFAFLDIQYFVPMHKWCHSTLNAEHTASLRMILVSSDSCGTECVCCAVHLCWRGHDFRIFQKRIWFVTVWQLLGFFFALNLASATFRVVGCGWDIFERCRSSKGCCKALWEKA